MEAIANAAYEALPGTLRDHVDDVMIRVTEFPDRDVLEELGIEGEFGLLGPVPRGQLGSKKPGRCGPPPST